ncbi:MAG: HNH endonuclease signature motif containing protein [Planctomycetales bacterium]
MARNPAWSRDELLLAFRLYCQEPFGRLHTRNAAVRGVAGLIGRTAAAVVFKACNFASLDPFHQRRGVAGLRNVGRADVRLWEEFADDSEGVAAEAEAAFERYAAAALRPEEPSPGLSPREASGFEVAEVAPPHPNPLPRRVPSPDEMREGTERPVFEIPEGATEFEAVVRARRVQRFFRRAVLTSYGGACAISGVPVAELLNASHIVPWSADARRRADPRNGIALHALYDRAFDRGLLTFDEALRVVVSPELAVAEATPLHRSTLLEIAGTPLRPPDRFHPDPAALDYHRREVFRGKVEG